MDPLTPGNMPDPNSTVWPPPPTSQTTSPSALTFPFKTLFQYVKPSSVPTLRAGTLALYPEGVSIQGKAVTRYEIQVPILIITLFLRLFLVAYLLLEYAIRRDEFLNIPWASVRGVTLVPKRRRICLVYDAPNYKGVVKTFSLTFQADPMQYAVFAENIPAFLPDRVTEGRLRGWTSPPVWIFCGGVLVSLLIIGVLLAVSPQSLRSLH